MIKKMNKKGQLLPQTNSNNGILAWFEQNPVWFIIIATIVMIAVLASIQIVTCSEGWGGTCLKVACFGKFGLC